MTLCHSGMKRRRTEDENGTAQDRSLQDICIIGMGCCGYIEKDYCMIGIFVVIDAGLRDGKPVPYRVKGMTWLAREFIWLTSIFWDYFRCMSMFHHNPADSELHDRNRSAEKQLLLSFPRADWSAWTFGIYTSLRCFQQLSTKSDFFCVCRPW